MPNLDLNLLRTFDALMEHRSVTKAAASLSVTQSAVSHALARLRSALDDPLFVRGAGVLQPTALAELITGGVRRGLGEFQEALAGSNFDPAHAQCRFTISASAYFCGGLIPELVQHLRREAPHVSLAVVPVTDSLLPMLDRGEIDLALGAAIETPPRFVVEPLYAETFVWVAAASNPIARRKVSAERLRRAPQVAVVTSGPFSAASHALNALAVMDRAEQGSGDGSGAPARMATVYDSETAISIVARSDLIARVPERLAARAHDRDRIAVIETGAEKPTADLVMVWHSRRSSAQDLAWLRAAIHRITA